MNALGRFLEDEGLATTGISLVREHSEWMAPPRILWVPFRLGRPLGRPGDAAFQHRVIDAALALLDAPSGPVTCAVWIRPPVAATSASSVPSPPSATGQQSTTRSPRRPRIPRFIASAASAAAIDCLKLSGAQTM